jgi:L-fuconolactonase
VGRFPDQRFALDHIAKPPIRSGLLQPWADGLRRLAAFPNVYCKVSGLITEADWQHWTPTDLRPYLDTVLAAFGTQRVMFGSDWPVCTLAGTYAQVVGAIDTYVSALSADEQAAIWGGSATEFYHLEQKRDDNDQP